MCGRYTLRTRLTLLSQLYAAPAQFDAPPRYNIAPTQQVIAVRPQGTEAAREMVLLRWGLIPSWADDPRIGSKLINARAETLTEKPSFKNALRQRRCLILADGFYEWKVDGKFKQPYFIHRGDEQPFAFAGLWDCWLKADLPIESCSIITTTANELMAPLHERMPVILNQAAAEVWLNSDLDEPKALLPLLTPLPAEELELYPVRTTVNSVRNDSPDCLQRAVENDGRLFT